jgi:hypothetical protein
VEETNPAAGDNILPATQPKPQQFLNFKESIDRLAEAGAKLHSHLVTYNYHVSHIENNHRLFAIVTKRIVHGFVLLLAGCVMVAGTARLAQTIPTTAPSSLAKSPILTVMGWLIGVFMSGGFILFGAMFFGYVIDNRKSRRAMAESVADLTKLANAATYEASLMLLFFEEMSIRRHELSTYAAITSILPMDTVRICELWPKVVQRVAEAWAFDHYWSNNTKNLAGETKQPPRSKPAPTIPPPKMQSYAQRAFDFYMEVCRQHPHVAQMKPPQAYEWIVENKELPEKFPPSADTFARYLRDAEKIRRLAEKRKNSE